MNKYYHINMKKSIRSTWYTGSMQNHKGFTIVELLIVIVVIGVLASITIVAFNGIQKRAENTKTITAVNQTAKLLQLYKETNGDYPTGIPSMVCIGVGYPNNVCSQNADNTSQVYTSTIFHDYLKTVGSVPQPSTKVLTRDMGRTVAGASWQSASRMIRYYLNGASTPCDAGGTGYNYDDVTECRLVLPAV